jgi:hypothetical protein
MHFRMHRDALMNWHVAFDVCNLKRGFQNEIAQSRKRNSIEGPLIKTKVGF